MSEPGALATGSSPKLRFDRVATLPRPDTAMRANLVLCEQTLRKYPSGDYAMRPNVDERKCLSNPLVWLSLCHLLKR